MVVHLFMMFFSVEVIAMLWITCLYVICLLTLPYCGFWSWMIMR